MPTYDYLCRKKHKVFEYEHSIKEKLNECPLCKEEGCPKVPVERLISKTSFQLIGGGWAKDLYK